MTDLSVNNLTVGGVITFSDDSFLNSALVRALQNISQFDRNGTSGVTSLLNDNLVINKDVRVVQDIESDKSKINSLVFKNDLDGDDQPIIQNVGFTGELRDMVHAAHDNIANIIPDIIDPPNKRMRFTNTENGSFTNIQSDSVEVNDNDGTSVRLQNTEIHFVTDNLAGQLSADTFRLANSSNQSITATCTQTIYDNGDGATFQIQPDVVDMQNGSANLEFTANGISMSNGDSNYTQTFYNSYTVGNAEINNQFKVEGITRNSGEVPFTMTMPKSGLNFFHFDSGKACTTKWITGDDKFVYAYCNAYVCDGKSETVMLGSVINYATYSTNTDGWYCWISNPTENFLDLYSDDNDLMCSPNQGILNGHGKDWIPPYSTLRLSLIKIPDTAASNAGSYCWAINV